MRSKVLLILTLEVLLISSLGISDLVLLLTASVIMLIYRGHTSPVSNYSTHGLNTPNSSAYTTCTLILTSYNIMLYSLGLLSFSPAEDKGKSLINHYRQLAQRCGDQCSRFEPREPPRPALPSQSQRRLSRPGLGGPARQPRRCHPPGENVSYPSLLTTSCFCFYCWKSGSFFSSPAEVFAYVMNAVKNDNNSCDFYV